MLTERLKQRLAATWIAPPAIRMRHLLDIWLRSISRLEAVETAAQDCIGEKLLVRMPQADTTFVDVGAHVGAIIGQVRQHNSAVRIVAVEPVPTKAEWLRRLFPTAEIHACAAGIEDRNAEFYVDSEHSAHSSLVRPSETKITVPMNRLDTLLHERKSVDVIKIDVEGAELDVLAGARETIGQFRPLIVFESVEETAGIFDWFHTLDYGVYVPNRVAHNGPSLTESGFEEAHYYPRRTTNYFAIPTERRPEFRDRARRILRIAGR